MIDYDSLEMQFIDAFENGYQIDEIAKIYSVEYASVEEVIRDYVKLDYDNHDSMDGDERSALASIGWGTDEDYGYMDEML